MSSRARFSLRRPFYFLCHSVFLIVVVLMLQRLLILYKDEASVIQFTTLLKTVFANKEKPDPQSFLFINTSYDNQLVNVFDETGYIPIGNQVITDREKLIALLDICRQDSTYKYLIFDIFFENKSSSDDRLETLLNQTPRTISAHLLTQDDEIISPSIDIPTGGVSVLVLDDQFTKFRLSYSDTSYSLPLQVYLDKTNSRYRHGKFLSFLNDRPILNTFFLNYDINSYDLKVAKNYPVINLGDLLLLGQVNIQELVNDRWVIVGDFMQFDNMETLFGSMPGPLILTNVILALENLDMAITFWYVLFLLVSFYFVSTIVMNPNDAIANLLLKLPIGEGIRNFLKGISLLTILTTISSLSFLIFHIHVNIFILSLYLYAVDYTVRYRHEKLVIKANLKSEE